jgi:hypothetical protein
MGHGWVMDGMMSVGERTTESMAEMRGPEDREQRVESEESEVQSAESEESEQGVGRGRYCWNV